MTVALRPVGTFTVPPDHPCLSGHFPGHPIVPGVVLLDEALALIAPDGNRAVAVTSAKFTVPVLPGQVVEVRCGPVVGEQLSFAGLVDGETVVHGVVRIAGPES